MVMGTHHVRAGGGAIAAALGGDAINLIGRTNIAEALAIVRQLQLMVSDDGGLMHLAWTNGIPTVALFGATRSAWSRPCGAHARWFGSEDLPCGACMNPTCARGDRHCLERISVQKVMETVKEIVPRDR
ncbi:MAG: Heptosyltransferase III [Chlorobi bacterium OLB7]|nr:MAG: Heptosyltransferase III [Chlorobi bacterium OLB7]